MATTVTNTKPLAKKGTGRGPGFPGANGPGSQKRNGHDRPFSQHEGPANRYRIGMWVALAAILMMFTALSSAYIVRAASSNDWQPLVMPRILLLSTTLILVSSGTLEASRRKLKTMDSRYVGWLAATVVLGMGFLASQLFAWRQLVRQGVYLASNPHSSFFYLLTATHGLHLFCGLLALGYLLMRTRQRVASQATSARRLAIADAVTLYWHFMDGLWIYLFLLLFFWR